MKLNRKFTSIAIAAITLTAIAIPSSIALASPHDATTTIYACEDNTAHTIVIVADSASCTTDQTLLQWNVTGPVGPMGPLGATGPQGPKGDTGAAGTNGTDGLPGAKGDTGPIGPQGPKGDTGAQGPQGNQGNQGFKGDTGAAGPVGPTGPQGATGVQGPKGDTGAQGVPGLSKYAVVNTPVAVVSPGQIVSANCPTGDMVISGGAQLGTRNHGFALSMSRPSDPHHAWQTAYSSDNGSKTTLQVWAICAAVA